MVSGKTVISDEVFIALVKESMAKVESVDISLEDDNSLKSFAKRLTERVVPPITVKKTDAVNAEGEEAAAGHVAFEVKIAVVYGAVIPKVIVELRKSIVNDVEALTGYTVDKVDVIIDGIVRPKPEAKEEEPEVKEEAKAGAKAEVKEEVKAEPVVEAEVVEEKPAE